MHKDKLKTYMDNSALSAYVAWSPTSPVQHTQWAMVQVLFETAAKRGLRFVSSQFIVGEAEKGHKGAAARRKNAIRGLTLIPETTPIYKQSLILLNRMQGTADRKRLAGDARHYACAVACKAKFLVTWDIQDFSRIDGLAEGLGWEDRPKIITPTDAAFYLGKEIIDNPPSMREALNRKTPWIQKILRENEAIQIKLCTPLLKKHGLI